jgi:hypothetical protein
VIFRYYGHCGTDHAARQAAAPIKVSPAKIG